MGNSLVKPSALESLKDFQIEALEWGLTKRAVHYWLPCGSGKTRISLLWALLPLSNHSSVMQLTETKQVVVVVTKTAVCRQWRDEIQELTNAKVQILRGERPPDPLDKDADIYIVGYDVLPAHAEQLSRVVHALIVDEAHRCKSHKRWEAIVSGEDPTAKPTFRLRDNEVAAAWVLSRKAKRRCALTATPMPNGRPEELWGQLDLIEPDKWGRWIDYGNKYCDFKAGQYGGLDTKGITKNKEALAELDRRLEQVTFFVDYKRVNAELPPKRRRVYRIPIEEQVRALAISGELKSAARQGQRQLREMLLMEAASRKRKVVLDYVGDAIEHSQKSIVFTGRRKDCDYLENAVQSLGEWSKGKHQPQVWGVHGGKSDSERYESIRSYMESPGPSVLVATVDSCGESVNLQRTHKVFVVMLPYTVAKVIQLEGRVARIGQLWPVEIIYLIAEGTVDNRVASILLDKLPVVEQIVGSTELEGFTEELQGGSEEELLAQMFEGFSYDRQA